MRIERSLVPPQSEQSTAPPDVAVARLAARQYTACLPPEHVTTWRGIPITTPERTLLDLAGVLNRDQLRRAIRQSQFLGLTTLGSLVAALRGPGPSDAFQRALDRERQAILEAHGYRVLRVTWAQAIAQPGRTLRRFWDAKAPRAVDGSASR